MIVTLLILLFATDAWATDVMDSMNFLGTTQVSSKNICLADGTNCGALSGDVTTTAGSLVTTIGANSVALGTDTTGGYAASGTEGGNATNADNLEGVDWGTLTDTKWCVYNNGATQVDCNVNPVTQTTECASAGCTLNSATVASTPAANDNDTSVATSAFVIGELTAAGGRSVTNADATTGVLDADPELYTQTKCMTIESPTSADDFLMFRAVAPGTTATITVTSIDCIVVGGTNSALLIKECDANGANCTNTEASITCTTSNTQVAGASIDDATIDNGDWVRMDPGTQSGTNTQIAACVTYTVAD